jgi:hypothetical protein
MIRFINLSRLPQALLFRDDELLSLIYLSCNNPLRNRVHIDQVVAEPYDDAQAGPRRNGIEQLENVRWIQRGSFAKQNCVRPVVCNLI